MYLGYLQIKIVEIVATIIGKLSSLTSKSTQISGFFSTGLSNTDRTNKAWKVNLPQYLQEVFQIRATIPGGSAMVGTGPDFNPPNHVTASV